MPAVVLLRAELDVIEEFARIHCTVGGQAVCARMQQRAQTLVGEMLSSGGQVPAHLSTARAHGWDIFGSGHEVTGVFAGAPLLECHAARTFHRFHLEVLTGTVETEWAPCR